MLNICHFLDFSSPSLAQVPAIDVPQCRFITNKGKKAGWTQASQ
jgi:hypothetical protein